MHLFAAKRQQPASQVGGPAGRGHDFSHVSPQRVFGGQGVQHELGISADHQKQVVEIVGHPAGQSAIGIHFLCLLQFRLQPASLG